MDKKETFYYNLYIENKVCISIKIGKNQKLYFFEKKFYIRKKIPDFC